MKRFYRNDVSQETKAKQSLAHQGRKHSNSTKNKISKALCNYWAKLPLKPTDNNNNSKNQQVYGDGNN
jgi:hypothetical protein